MVKYPNLYHIIREIGLDNGMNMLKKPNWSSVVDDFVETDSDLKLINLDKLEDIARKMSPEEQHTFAAGEFLEIEDLVDKYDQDDYLHEFLEEAFDGVFTDAFFERAQPA